MRSEMTDAERALWMRLRARRLNGLSFRRQTPIGPFIVDFVCHERRLVIELDGGHHNDLEEMQRDAKRQQWLEANGYHVLRFWNPDVLSHCDLVLEEILETIAQPTPPSLTRPHKGGGNNEAHTSNTNIRGTQP